MGGAGSVTTKSTESYTDLTTLGASATYAQIEALVEQIAGDTWKNGKAPLIQNSLTGVAVYGINILTGEAHIGIIRGPQIESFTLSLGSISGKTLAEIYDHIDGKTFVAGDLSSKIADLQTAENTTLLVNALISRGKITGNVIWATATAVAGPSGARYIEVTVALDSGNLVTFTLSIATTSTGQAVVNAESFGIHFAYKSSESE